MCACSVCVSCGLIDMWCDCHCCTRSYDIPTAQRTTAPKWLSWKMSSLSRRLRVSLGRPKKPTRTPSLRYSCQRKAGLPVLSLLAARFQDFVAGACRSIFLHQSTRWPFSSQFPVAMSKFGKCLPKKTFLTFSSCSGLTVHNFHKLFIAQVNIYWK